jgi:Purple acid Phosphatase, N-terminal domain/Right handed beta helix region
VSKTITICGQGIVQQACKHGKHASTDENNPGRLVLLFLLSTFIIGAQSLPELPRVYVNTSLPVQSGTVRNVASDCGNLQAQLNAAQLSDTIVIPAGAVCRGSYTLPNKTGNGWIVIRSSASNSLPSGVRVTPAQAGLMPKILSPGSSPAFSAADSAHHYRLIGLEISIVTNPEPSINYNLILLGGGPETQKSLSQMPHHIFVDRCYVHGTPTAKVRRGVAFNGTDLAVIDSYISDIHEGTDSQAVASWNGAGPFKIVNNYLEAAGENILFTGPNSIAVPSDIEVRQNYMFKPRKWKVGDPSYAGIHWIVKNLFEIKNGQRVLLEGNVLENCWTDAQIGWAILLNGIDGPNSLIENVTVRNNKIKGVERGVDIAPATSASSPQMRPTNHVLIENNTFDLISNGALVFGGTSDITIRHNTVHRPPGPGYTALTFTPGVAKITTDRFYFTDNFSDHGDYGIHGDGRAVGADSMRYYAPYGDFRGTALANAWNPNLYSGYGMLFPPTFDGEVVNAAAGDYHLKTTSMLKGAGSDGKDVGADIDTVEKSAQAALSGTSGATSPPPSSSLAISGVAASTPTAHEVTITWTTTEAADSQVEFGTTSEHAPRRQTTSVDPALVTKHSVKLTGLAPQTLYHYRVKSKTADGRTAVSADNTFQTATAASITVSRRALFSSSRQP